MREARGAGPVRRFFWRAPLGAALGLLLTWALPGAPADAQNLRIDHVTVVSPERERPMPDVTVTVAEGRIAAISTKASPPPATRRLAATVLDGHGLYLTPGLIDSHVHLGAIPGMTGEQEQSHADIARAAREQLPRSYLYHGFTTLIDLISTPEEMATWKSQGLGPDTYFCGGAPVLDGYPMNYLSRATRYDRFPYLLVERGRASPLPEGVDPKEHAPEAVVTRMKSDGAICVKTFYEHGFGGVSNLPVPRLETIRELVRAAHQAGLPVLLHANSEEAQAFGLEAGVDILAHGLWNWKDTSRTSELTAGVKSILDRVLSGKVGWQPTIQVLYGLRDLYSDSYLSDPQMAHVLPAGLIDWYRSPEGRWFRDAVAKDADPKTIVAAFNVLIERDEHAVAYLAARGGRLLFGTDTPSAPTYANPPGLNGWLEMHRLIDAGLTPAQIFRAATLSNAQALHLDKDIGTVEVGKVANLLLLHADPTESVEAYGSIAKVILRGRAIDRGKLAADRPSH